MSINTPNRPKIIEYFHRANAALVLTTIDFGLSDSRQQTILENSKRGAFRRRHAQTPVRKMGEQ